LSQQELTKTKNTYKIKYFLGQGLEDRAKINQTPCFK